MIQVSTDTYLLCDSSIICYTKGVGWKMYPSKEWKKETKNLKYEYKFTKQRGLKIFEQIDKLLRK